ncbi:MAG: ABC transporter ATP-binding protein [Oscillochloris sp.]|nr:ABC transporter ATP-binding protein [Oscillochloris sp.]
MSTVHNPNVPIFMRHADRQFEGGAGVHDISLTVPAGTIFGLIGPSGCGKTTTVRLLTGIYRPDSGEVQVLGRPPHRFSQRYRKQIGYVPQQFALYKLLSVRENLQFAASLQGMNLFGRQRRLNEMLDFVELRDARNRLADHLSGGMQRRLMLACALIHEPQILFADEPTAGIDPVLREKIWDGFRHSRDEGRSIFVTTQYVGEAAYCDLVGVMGMGEMIAVDTPANLRRRALGGDILRIVVPGEQIFSATTALRRHQELRRLRYSHDEPGVIYVTVDDAGAALPHALDVLRAVDNLQIRSAQPHVPPFDEVFVRLMTQQEAVHA